MNLIAEIKYKKDDYKSDIQLMLIAFSIMVSIFLVLLVRSVEATAICSVVVLLEIIFFGKTDGIVRLYESDNIYSIEIEDEGKSKIIEKVMNHKFRWSYNYVSTTSGPSGAKRASHINYIFTRVEFTLSNGKRIILGKELNQWKSAPTNWEYEVLIKDESEFLGITSHNLVKLKQQMDAIPVKHQNRM